MAKRVTRPTVSTSKQQRPRGGRTTMTEAGLVRKTVYFTPQEWQAIRLAAFEQNVAYSHVIQGVVRKALMADGSR